MTLNTDKAQRNSNAPYTQAESLADENIPVKSESAQLNVDFSSLSKEDVDKLIHSERAEKSKLEQEAQDLEKMLADVKAETQGLKDRAAKMKEETGDQESGLDILNRM